MKKYGVCIFEELLSFSLNKNDKIIYNNNEQCIIDQKYQIADSTKAYKIYLEMKKNIWYLYKKDYMWYGIGMTKLRYLCKDNQQYQKIIADIGNIKIWSDDDLKIQIKKIIISLQHNIYSLR